VTAARANPLFADLRARVATSASQAPPSFREFLSSRRWCGLTLSPVVAAIADASEGRAIELPDDTAVRIFGCEADLLPRAMRRTVVVRAGGRGGKTSRLLAPKAIHAALTVPLPTVAAGEHARALLIAPDKSLALQALGYVRGYLEETPSLAPTIERDTTECITIRRPSDKQLVDITIGAATRGAKAARGRTLVFVGMDEAAFFYADDGYTVTDKEIYRAAIQRIVPGGQAWIVSTPWLEGIGVMEERLAEDFGRHEKSLVAVGGTRDLNPTWDPTGEIERDMRDSDPENAAREIDAVPLAAGTKFFFPPEVVRLAVSARTEPLPPLPSAQHYAGTDLGFRKNSSALAIAREEAGVVRLAYHEEKRPARGEPLVPGDVVREFATHCMRYNARSMKGDLHYAESAKEYLREVRDTMGRQPVRYEDFVPTMERNAEMFTEFRRLMAEKKLELPKDARLLSQIRQTTMKALDGGRVRVMPPKQGQAHGDVLMAVVIACVAAAGTVGGGRVQRGMLTRSLGIM